MSTYTILKNDAGVQALVTQIYMSQAPQGVSAPYVVLRISSSPENYVSTTTNQEQNLYAVNCWGIDQSKSIAIFEACRAALEPTGLVELLPIYGELDDKTKYYLTLFDFSVWEDR